MNSYQWYAELIKPEWAPPAWLFGPVWTVLYLIIVLTFGYVTLSYFKGKISFIVFLPFILNVIFNLIFTPIQFGLKNLPLATLDIFLVLATLVWAIIAIFPFSRTVALASIPYLLWVTFATVLQTTITYLNSK